MKKLLTLTAIVLFADLTNLVPAKAQPPSTPRPTELGIPFITNWSPKEYGQHKQNWAIVQDNRGVMYFGNGNGVLEYDGVNWRLISLPTESWALSLAIDPNGRIYVGAETEIGYLSPDSVGRMQYVSLMANVPEQYRDFGEVWETLATDHGIYFRASEYLFRWKISNASGQGDLHVWKPKTSFYSVFLVEDKLYVQQQEIGMMEVAGDSLQLAPAGEKFPRKWIYVMLPFDQTEY